MAATIYNTATEYVWVQLVEIRGTLSTDTTTVGMYLTLDPNDIPEVEDFHDGILVKPGTEPLGDPVGGKTWLGMLIGPSTEPGVFDPGDYQTFTLISVGAENIIRRAGVLTVLGEAA